MLAILSSSYLPSAFCHLLITSSPWHNMRYRVTMTTASSSPLTLWSWGWTFPCLFLIPCFTSSVKSGMKAGSLNTWYVSHCDDSCSITTYMMSSPWQLPPHHYWHYCSSCLLTPVSMKSPEELSPPGNVELWCFLLHHTMESPWQLSCHHIMALPWLLLSHHITSHHDDSHSIIADTVQSSWLWYTHVIPARVGPSLSLTHLWSSPHFSHHEYQ